MGRPRSECEEWQQEQRAERESQAGEGEGREVVASESLCDKACAPDDGCGEEQ
jgi:hypothetical protein